MCIESMNISTSLWKVHFLEFDSTLKMATLCVMTGRNSRRLTTLQSPQPLMAWSQLQIKRKKRTPTGKSPAISQNISESSRFLSSARRRTASQLLSTRCHVSAWTTIQTSEIRSNISCRSDEINSPVPTHRSWKSSPDRIGCRHVCCRNVTC